VVQEWETGDVEFDRMVQLETNLWREDRVQSSCGWKEICFCSATLSCALPGWAPSPASLRLPPLATRASRRLADEPALMNSADGNDITSKPPTVTYVPKGKRGKVRVVFGLEVTAKLSLLSDNDPLDSWTFTPSFDLRQPWTQRNLYAFCTDLPEELQVVRDWCWIRDFKRWVVEEGGRFPVHANEFQEVSMRYLEEGKYATRGTRYLWVLGSEVKGVYNSFEVNVASDAPADVLLEYKAKWDAYLEKYNQEAWRTARGAFHVSSLWVKAESEGHLISSTVNTMLILLLLAFGGMLAVTRSCALSLFVVGSTAFVLTGLAFFIVVLMRWEIGLIEVIAVIYFIGYALDYSLHVAHKYAGSEALSAPLKFEEPPSGSAAVRLHRTAFALRSIGGAAVGSAVTTAGASFFLTFCQLTIFKKLGSMCLAVTLTSILTALGPLPAALLLCGPLQPGSGCGRVCRIARQRLLGDLAGAGTGGTAPRARE